MSEDKPILFLKSHVKGYTKKDGTVVKDHEDKRPVNPPAFHVTREADGDEFIDSTHTHFSGAKQRMMDVHKEDAGASPMVTHHQHGILAFPHVDTGKPTTTPAYKKGAKAAHPGHAEHWQDK